MRALQIASTGMMAQQTNVEVISNNIANMSTTGYKRRRAEFQDLLYQNMRRVGSQSSENGSILPAGAQVGLGVKTAAIYRIGEQGSLSQTDNRFDIAIRGNGFFQVQMPGGQLGYTRAGNFTVSSEGQLVTQQGFPVQPAIQIPEGASAIAVSQDGIVSAQLDGESEPAELGQLQVASFTNPAGLRAIGDNFLTETGASGPAQMGNPGETGRGGIRQGTLEASNVNIVEELVDMIEAQRAYEINSKMVSAVDEMLRNANQTL